MADEDGQSSASQPLEPEQAALPVDSDPGGRRKSVAWVNTEVPNVDFERSLRTTEQAPPLLEELPEGTESSTSNSDEGDGEPSRQVSSEPEESLEEVRKRMAQQGHRKSVVWCASVGPRESESDLEQQPQAKPKAKSRSRPALARTNSLSVKRRSLAAEEKSPRRQSEKSISRPSILERRQSERRMSKKAPRRQSRKSIGAGPRRSMTAALAAASTEPTEAFKKSRTEPFGSESKDEVSGTQEEASSDHSDTGSVVGEMTENQAGPAAGNIQSSAKAMAGDLKSSVLASRQSVVDVGGVRRPSTLEVGGMRRPSNLEVGGMKRSSILEVGGMKRSSILEVAQPMQLPRRPSWRQENTQENKRTSVLMGLDDSEGKFRETITRRQIYSNAKQMMEEDKEDSSDSDSNDENKSSKRPSKLKRLSAQNGSKKASGTPFTFKQISQVVAESARKVVFKRRIADLFTGIKYERALREQLARVTQKSLKERDWEQLLVDLNDIHEEVKKEEASKGVQINLSLFSQQVSSAALSLKAQQDAVAKLQDCMEDLMAFEEEHADHDPEALWIKVLDVQDHLQSLERSTEEFSEMMLVLGFPKHLGKADDSDEDGDKPSAASDQAQNILSNVPPLVLQRLKNSLADAHDENWQQEEAAARAELSQLGATEQDMPHVLRSLRAEVWSQCVNTAVTGLQTVDHDGESLSAHKINHAARAVEEKLMKAHPDARHRAEKARRKNRQSFKIHLQRKMSVFNKEHRRRSNVYLYNRPGTLHGLHKKLAELNEAQGMSPRRASISNERSAEAREVIQEVQAQRRRVSVDFDASGSAKVADIFAASPFREALSNHPRSPTNHRLSMQKSASLLAERRKSHQEDIAGMAIVGRRTSGEGVTTAMYSVSTWSPSQQSSLQDSNLKTSGLRGSLLGNKGRLSQLSTIALGNGGHPAMPVATDALARRRSSSEKASVTPDALAPLPSVCNSPASSSSLDLEGCNGDDVGGAKTTPQSSQSSQASSRGGSPLCIAQSSARGYGSRRGGSVRLLKCADEIHSEEERIREIKSQHAGQMVVVALGELLESISLRWSSFEEAQTFLSTCGGDVGGDGRIAMSTLHEALRALGYRRSCAEVCCLFLALGVPCSERSTLSIADFARLSNFADWHDREEPKAQRAEFLLGQIELRRVIVDSLTDSEKLLAQLHLALARVSDAASAKGRHICTGDEKETEEDAALCRVLHGCCKQLAAPAPGSTNFAQTMLTQLGLAVFLAVTALTSALVVVRSLAVYIVSQALVIQGLAEVTEFLPGSHAKIPSIVDLMDVAQLHAMRVGSEDAIGVEYAAVSTAPVAAEASNDLAALHPESPLSLLKAASARELHGRRSAWQTPTSPSSWSVAHQPREPTEREKFLMANLWRPLLDVVDPEGPGPPPPLDSRFLASLLQIFQQVRVPEIVVGPGCAAVAPLVAASLHRLHLAHIATPVLEKVLQDFELLEESHEMMGNPNSETASSAQVHMLAVAFGGCRLLREQLAQLPTDCDSGSVQKGERILRMWRGIRQRLLRRWPASKQHASRLPMVQAITKATIEAGKEGFDLEAASLTPSILLTSGSSKVALPPMRLNCIGGCLFEEGSIELELTQRLVRRWQSTKALGRCVESSASLISREHTPGQTLSSLMAHGELPTVRAQTAPAGTSPASGRMPATLSPGSRVGTADDGQRFKTKVMPWIVPAIDPNSELRSKTATPRVARHMGAVKDLPSYRAHLQRSMTATPRAAGHVDLLMEQVPGKLQQLDKVQVPRSLTATPGHAGRVGLRREQLTNKVQLPNL